MKKSTNIKHLEKVLGNSEGFRQSLYCVIKEIKEKYLENVPENIRILDSYIFFLVVIAVAQVIYCIIIQTTYPLDSFIGGVFCAIGTALLVSVLRIQLTCPSFFNDVSPKTAFNDFMICCTVFLIGCASLLV